MKGLALGTIALGFILFALSGLWPNMFSKASSWTDEKANRSADVKARMAYLGGIVNSPNPQMHGRVDPVSAKTELDALIKENDQLNAEFESAANSPKTTSKFLKWSGIGLALLGIIGYYAVNQTS